MNRKSPLLIALFGLFVALVATPAFAGWSTSIERDNVTGKRTGYAFSDNATATKKMKSGVEAWLGVGCVGFQEWAYVGFSDTPKLDNTTEESGHSLIRTKIKWDGKAEEVVLTQDPGASVLHFHADKAVISGIARSYTVVLDLDWHGEGTRHFEFSLKGSSAALASIRRACSGK